MKTFFVFLFWLFLFALLAVACWGIALWNSWPAWGALFLYFSIIGLWFLGKFLIRLFLGWRARSRTAQPVEKPELTLSPESTLKNAWKEAIYLITHSDLKRLGNPLYVLPWYMVIGHAGSGKTTALANTRLLSPLKKIDPTINIEPTQNVEWWYFDKAIVMDTTGRYVAPEHQEANSKEWDKMLDLLGHYRFKEGLNGLVITVSVDQLLHPDPDQLANEGRVIRLRIEQLIRLFDKRFPVYILVTKCDLLYGMETWSQLLPNNWINQAMGYINPTDNGATDKEAEFVDNAFEIISTRLKRLQLAFMQRANSMHNADPNLLLFPHEFSKLRAGLKLFLRHAQGESPYLESALLRGLFFCSGLQQGGATSTILSDIAPCDPLHPPSHKSIFLHDLFDQILPADRYFLRPAAIINHWRRITRQFGLVAWLFLNVAGGFYFSFSFVYTLDTLNTMRNIYPEGLDLTGLLYDDTNILDKFRKFGYWLEKHDSQRLSQFLAYDSQIIGIEQKIKKNYVAKFRRYILPVFNDEMNKTLRSLARQGRNEELANLIQALARNINMVQARVNGADHEQLLKMPPISANVLLELNPKMLPDFANLFDKMYVSFLAWQPPEQIQLRDLDEMRAILSHVALDSQDLNWVVSWANAQPDLQSIDIPTFWRGSRHVEGLTRILPAFTSNGKERIDAFLQEVRKSAPNPLNFDGKLAQFNQWYFNEKLNQWQNFTWNFSQGEQTLNGLNEWRSTISRLTSLDSPYVLLINQLTSEFSGSDSETNTAGPSLPNWLRLTQQLFTLRLRASQQSFIGIPATINDVGGKILKDLAQTGQITQASSTLRAQINAVKVYQAYTAALVSTVNEEVISTAKATQVATQFHNYANDPSAKSALQDGYARLTDLARLLGSGQADEQVAWSLLAGPLQLAIRFADMQASCVLQQAWEAKVLWPLQASSGMPDLVDKLYGSSGAVWSFLDGPAKPFIRRDASNYIALETLGQVIPFTPEFLPFVNAAISWQVEEKVTKEQQENAVKKAEVDRQQQQQQWETRQQQTETQLASLTKTRDGLLQTSYPISITGLPTGINQQSKALVIGTLLSVQCAKAPFNLNNLNFSLSGSFNWSQSSCNDTSLQIRFPDFTISKTYPGAQGFVGFLQDFRNGSHTFTPNDFPSDQSKLTALGIKTITVRYQFNGQSLILEGYKQQGELDQAIKKAQDDKQTIQTALANLNQQALQSKLASSDPVSVPMTVQIPGKIGQCWSNNGARPPKSPPVRKVIDELAAAILASAPVATVAPSAVPTVTPTTKAPTTTTKQAK